MTPHNLNILLADDQNDFRDLMKQILEGKGWTVSAHSNVKSAQTALTAASRENRKFDVAILDFRLPTHEMDTRDPVDETLCNTLRPTSFVIHITAFLDDPAVQKHNQRCHPPAGQPMILKKDADIFERTVSCIEQIIHTTPIREKLDSLRARPGEGAPGRLYRPDASVSSASNLALQICHDIKTSWPYLHSQFQQELTAIFNVIRAADGTIAAVEPK